MEVFHDFDLWNAEHCGSPLGFRDRRTWVSSSVKGTDAVGPAFTRTCPVLVLSRYPSQNERDIFNTICIGDSIVVRVLEVRGDKVRIGVEAPADVRIIRAELMESEGDV